MEITSKMRQIALQAIRQKGLKQSDIATEMGYGKAWVTMFLKQDGKNLKKIDNDALKKLEGILGTPLFTRVEETPTSPVAQRLHELMTANPQLEKLGLALIEAFDGTSASGVPYIPTKDMTRVGQEIIKAAFANEHKPGKVARLVIEMLSDEKLRPRKEEKPKPVVTPGKGQPHHHQKNRGSEKG